MQDITIIGTSHIAKQSIKEVKDTIEAIKPDIVAVELDKNRLSSLLSKDPGKITLGQIKVLGITGFIFAMIGKWVQQKLAKVVGTKPGDDMLVAVRIARKEKIKIALIDQDIRITLKKLTTRITWKEKWNFIADIFKGIFFKKKQMEEMGITEFDLSSVPDKDLITKLIKNVKGRYPTVYEVLIHERNIIMANNIFGLKQHFSDAKILAVVGAGHEEDILRLLENKFLEDKD